MQSILFTFVWPRPMVVILAVLVVALTIEDVFSACTNPSCSDPPCAASLLGDHGCTTVAGTAVYSHELISKGDTIPIGTHIYGPFEAGFTSRQESIIQGWGCSDASVAYDGDGGTDVGLATKHVAYKCNIDLPRIDTSTDTYYGIVGACGGHVGDYHFHGSLSCLYSQTGGGHSTQVGQIAEHYMYGKWEDYDNQFLPLLDACGAHFGVNPDSGGESVYHYHTQDKAPFTSACHGPSSSNGLVSVSVCRALYSECNDGQAETFTLSSGDVQYDRYCPCFDANGNNVGSITELPALGTTDISYAANTSEVVRYGISAYTECTDCASSASTDEASRSFSYLGIVAVMLLRLNHL